MSGECRWLFGPRDERKTLTKQWRTAVDKSTRFHRGKLKMRSPVITLIVMLIVPNLALPKDVAHSSSKGGRRIAIDSQSQEEYLCLYREVVCVIKIL